MAKRCVLAFSGGLDTSFCVPWLVERGWDVIAYFVDTGGAADEGGAEAILARARELGAADAVAIDARAKLWETIVAPMLWAGEKRQGVYPLLCSDRYLIVEEGVALAKRVGATAIAHGCTAMGNDQARFDIAVNALSELEVLAPIRALQDGEGPVRPREIAYLQERGHPVSAQAKRYTVNLNALGATMSGGEIDAWGAPSEDARILCAPRADWPSAPLRARITFERGRPVALDGVAAGADMLPALNESFGAYGVGRDLYTGDVAVGLKGRILFEAPGLEALMTAHRALSEATQTRSQTGFRPTVGRLWADLVYDGRYFDPLRADLEAFLESSQARVSGDVTVETDGGAVRPAAIESPHILEMDGATYAQESPWTGLEAEAFLKLSGLGLTIWRAKGGTA